MSRCCLSKCSRSKHSPFFFFLDMLIMSQEVEEEDPPEEQQKEGQGTPRRRDIARRDSQISLGSCFLKWTVPAWLLCG
eukprot:jgi/Botrbrau1/2370/Bobra.0395s0005.1